jgi:hypothetical protein
MSNVIYCSICLAMLPFVTVSTAHADNPCIDSYPAISGQILRSNGGRVARLEPVKWFEDGVYRVTVESGGDFMTRPGGLPLPEVGSELQYRIFSKDANSEPIAACYCVEGTDLCVEEYSFN